MGRSVPVLRKTLSHRLALGGAAVAWEAAVDMVAWRGAGSSEGRRAPCTSAGKWGMAADGLEHPTAGWARHTRGQTHTWPNAHVAKHTRDQTHTWLNTHCSCCGGCAVPPCVPLFNLAAGATPCSMMDVNPVHSFQVQDIRAQTPRQLTPQVTGVSTRHRLASAALWCRRRDGQ